jgi:glutamine synthetase
MEVMHKIAVKNGLAVIFHSKPFKGLNGSGKHNNWGFFKLILGLNTEDGSNLFKPGKSKYEQDRFMTFLAALVYAVYIHGDVLRVGTANASNDHRLGGILQFN